MPASIPVVRSCRTRIEEGRWRIAKEGMTEIRVYQRTTGREQPTDPTSFSTRIDPTMLRILLIVMFLSLSVAGMLAQDRPARPASSAGTLAAYMGSIDTLLPANVRGALGRIPSTSRRLLAMKYYLRRSREEIARKWAWSAEEIRRYRRSREYGEAAAELDKIRKRFGALNPGYAIEVKMEIRTLGEQIGKWNATGSIGRAAAEVIDTCLKLMADSAGIFASGPTSESLAAFITFLREYEPATIPTVAVPGLSQHGQLRAFDFRIVRGGRVVAGASTSSIPRAWDGAGWTERLGDAICSVSDRFFGPLYDPYEPWHYTYVR
jgi:hypothetical protein